jgi:hypothetical protein
VRLLASIRTILPRMALGQGASITRLGRSFNWLPPMRALFSLLVPCNHYRNFRNFGQRTRRFPSEVIGEQNLGFLRQSARHRVRVPDSCDRFPPQAPHGFRVFVRSAPPCRSTYILWCPTERLLRRPNSRKQRVPVPSLDLLEFNFTSSMRFRRSVDNSP